MADLDAQPRSIQSTYGWFAEQRLSVNRRYQRKLVWTLEEKQKLIESVLAKYPIPAILLAEREDSTYEIIDGLQRLYTLMSFIEGGFPTLDGRYFDVAHFPSAKTRADEGVFEVPETEGLLTQREVSTFLDYSLAITVMRGATEAEIDDVFARINTYGHRLSDQERRQAGVQDAFSEMVREVACVVRGDASSATLDLAQMPAISIDLPMTKHGYQVLAEEVTWVQQGVLRSTDLRDSMDEQCIADIAACIVGGSLIERSKSALDEIYRVDSPENERIGIALDAYGADRFSDEFKFCVDEILKVTQSGTPTKLRELIFEQTTTNAFPSIFAVIVVAFHEVLIGQNKRISDYVGVKESMRNAVSRLETTRRATSPDERRRNIDVVKGMLLPHTVDGLPTDEVYNGSTTADIDATIRRSQIETPSYELKQGMISLGDERSIDPGVIDKVVNTISAIANNGKDRGGSVIVGIADKPADSERIATLDGVEPRKVGKRYVVGVNREAALLNETPEEYFARWKHGIRNSDLSQPLKDAVLSGMDYHEYFGLGLIIVRVPPQVGPSYVGDNLYWRDGDETKLAPDAPTIGGVVRRF